MTTDEKFRGILDRFAYQYEKVVKTHGTTVKDIIPVYDKALTAIKEIMVEKECSARLACPQERDCVKCAADDLGPKMDGRVVGEMVKKPSVEQMEKMLRDYKIEYHDEEGAWVIEECYLSMILDDVHFKDLAKFLCNKMEGR